MFQGGWPDEENQDDENKDESNYKWFAILAGVLAIVGGCIWYSRETGQEITFIQFQNELVPSGYVHRIEVVNRKKVRVFMRNIGMVSLA